MTRLEPVPRDELEAYEPFFQLVEAAMGFVPTSMRVMARWPDLFQAFSGLSATILATGPLDEELRHLVSHVASTAAGCEYCQAHTAAHGIHSGVAAERFEHVWEFETSDLFSNAERAMLRVARDAAQQPSAVTDEQVADLRAHYSDDEVLHALAVVSLFGYLNRFNGALATTLEDAPMAAADAHLRSRGWTPGDHA